SLRAWKDEIAGIRCASRSASRLEYGVLLWAKRRPDDVLSLLKRKPDPLRASEEHFFLRGHGCRLHRQRRLDPLVVRDEIAILKREQMCRVIGLSVATFVAEKDPRHCTRRVAEIVIGRAADTRRLEDGRVLRQLPYRRRLGPIRRSHAEVSGRRIV